MKVLLYNWVTHDDAEGRGGGVRIYHANLVRALARLPGVRVYTLSSGVSYDLLRRRVYIRERPKRKGTTDYEVVNSPVAAPAHAAFYSLDVYLRDTTLKGIVKNFLDAHGPFDVIQFDNLEGLTAGVLELKELYPATRFIYYMHNYNLICPQVNLWYAESRACDDYNEGKRCAVCLPRVINMREVKIAYAVSCGLQRVGIKPGSFVFRALYRHASLTKRVLRVIRRLGGGSAPTQAVIRYPASQTRNARAETSVLFAASSAGEIYRQYRLRNVGNVNDRFDRVLAVSQRVKELAVGFGIAASRISVVHIGTAFAERQVPIRVTDKHHLKIAYLGYERRDKGFYHFLDALETLPRSAARKISLLIAAQLRSPKTLARIKHLAGEFHDVEIVDGYDHGSLERLLEDVDLGVVPVLWEDSLPQVAMEFVAHGVPVLSSDLGGAKELCAANKRFVYRNGNVHDLVNKLLFFLDNRSALGSYDGHQQELMDMDRHARLIMNDFYQA